MLPTSNKRYKILSIITILLVIIVGLMSGLFLFSIFPILLCLAILVLLKNKKDKKKNVHITSIIAGLFIGISIIGFISYVIINVLDPEFNVFDGYESVRNAIIYCLFFILFTVTEILAIVSITKTIKSKNEIIITRYNWIPLLLIWIMIIVLLIAGSVYKIYIGQFFEYGYAGFVPEITIYYLFFMLIPTSILSLYNIFLFKETK